MIDYTGPCPHCGEPAPDGPPKTVVIVHDEDPSNPRVDFDEMSTMAFFHGRYDLGDKDHGLSTDDFDNWGAMRDHIEKELGGVLIFPVSLYDHSGITVSIGEPTCPWDSGYIGFIFVTEETLKKEYPENTPREEVLKRAESVLRGELKIYDQYLRGSVYGVRVFDEKGEEVDGCYGFFGFDHEESGLMDFASSYIEKGYALVEDF